MDNGSLSEHVKRRIALNFRAFEFICPCCGEEGVKDALVFKLQEAHNNLPPSAVMIISSGYRCPKHNAEVGGKETSSHLKGFAADIRADTPRERSFLIKALVEVGFTRIGIDFRRGMVHADVDPDKDQDVMWGYP